MYEVIVVSLDPQPHPDPEVHSLAICDVFGYTVIVGKDTAPGTLALYFPVDGQLSDEFASANDLVRRKDAAGNNAGGLFDPNRKVRAQKLRGVKSEGFAIPLESLAFTGGNIASLNVGDRLTEFNGVPIAKKYEVVRKTQGPGRAKNVDKKNDWFFKHIDTAQFRFEVSTLKPGALIHITEKLHGTSGRYTRIWDKVQVKSRSWRNLWRETVTETEQIVPLAGTRNVILGKTDGVGFYGAEEGFRTTICADWIDKLHVGEIVYGEIVGYLPGGGAIMPPADLGSLRDKSLTKKYGKHVQYAYGCAPSHPVKPQMDFYVYRITNVSYDGVQTDLSWWQVCQRAAELNLKVVPTAHESFLYDGDETKLRELVESLLEGESLVDSSHFREGVVIRAEEPSGRTKLLKSKSFTFSVCEGIAKEKLDEEGGFDLEESS